MYNLVCLVPKKPGTSLTQYMLLLPVLLTPPPTPTSPVQGLGFPFPCFRFLYNSAILTTCSLGSLLVLLFLGSLLVFFPLPFPLLLPSPPLMAWSILLTVFSLYAPRWLWLFSFIPTIKSFSWFCGPCSLGITYHYGFSNPSCPSSSGLLTSA